MNKFGELKTKIVTKLTESYTTGNMSEFKDIFNTVKKNNDFRELYLFYEEMENKTLLNKESAKQYIEEMVTLLKPKLISIDGIGKHLKNKVKDVEITENEIYTSIDQLLENETLFNIDKKINAKNRLVEHLVSVKEQLDDDEISNSTVNESILNAVLVGNFNAFYNQTLTESDKTELNKILSLNDDELKSIFTDLKEGLESTIGKLITEDTASTDLKEKLIETRRELSGMKPTKLNYYKLKELKNGFN
jgi:succinate dehydrogenase flavin-adding protein (antitoxin of CptAB toxin-antitoxin module)